MKCKCYLIVTSVIKVWQHELQSDTNMLIKSKVIINSIVHTFSRYYFAMGLDLKIFSTELDFHIGFYKL